MKNNTKPYGKLILFGFTTAILYTLLFFFEDEIMRNFTRKDGFHPALPVVTALIFSFSHGAFTSYFWDVMGIKGKQMKGAK